MVGAIAVGVVALAHVAFMVLESVLWTRPAGRRIFGMSADEAQTTRVLALNQGLYNGGLAVGLAWAIAVGNEGALLFLLAYITAMGVVGAITAKPTILFLQALPAAVAFGLVWFGI